METHKNMHTFSIVTPSLNQGAFIEETIRSVLCQDYPNVEYIIMDGGSKDETTTILERYSSRLTHWVSEPDRGQSHAINKGFSFSSGDILAYINSDDYYSPEIFSRISEIFSRDRDCHLIIGNCDIIENSRRLREFKAWWPEDVSYFLQPFGSPFAQPATFWTRELYEDVGGFNENSHYCFDREFFLRAAIAGYTPFILDKTLACYRLHPDIKTNRTIYFFLESLPVIEKYAQACGLELARKAEMIQEVENEIHYLKVFIEWKDKGRLQAIRKFLSMVSNSPSLLKERKILGQARRLLAFRADDVAELKNV